MRDDPRKLPHERLETIWAALIEAGHTQAAQELRDHISVLEEELTMVHQYYEESLLPGIEGRAVGAWSDRVVGVGRDGKPYIQEKSGNKIVLG